jgi:hypothetical protein
VFLLIDLITQNIFLGIFLRCLFEASSYFYYYYLMLAALYLGVPLPFLTVVAAVTPFLPSRFCTGSIFF